MMSSASRPGSLRQHVVVGGPQPARVGRLIRDAHDDAPVGRRTVVRQEPAAEGMLVQTAARFDERFEPRERRGEKLRLPEQPLGAAVDLGARLQAVGHQPIEVGDRAIAPAQLVVEREDLDDETGAEPEGRRAFRWRWPPRRRA